MIGSKLAHYEITSHLGTGGMGEVYQATDSKLGRSVAIKLLPEAFTHDAERSTRFEREARVLASLNHPHIAGIYGLEESGERKFLVMELVDGETLAERIKRGPIPVDESLQIAKQICEALESAHEKGIIHRDLKPANVKITPDGKVKVLDFGLAKAFENEPASAALSNSPTLSMAATNAGLILGTAAYMSPEQARGRKTDHRSDVFSFGCVFYEMLTGRQSFQGDELSDILASVLKTEPDLALLPANLNPKLHELLRRCLEKNLRNRWQAIGDIRFELELIAADVYRKPETASQVTPQRRTRERLVWISALAVIIGIAVVLILYSRPQVDQRNARFVILPPEKTNFSTQTTILAISPDGNRLTFLASGADGIPRLWIRPLDSLAAQPLPGTEGALFGPFWSPDSRFIGFFASGKLKKIDVNGGPPQTLCDAPTAMGGTWNRDGVILSSLGNGKGLYRVSAAGGQVTEFTKLDASRKETAHVWPHFLPDGRHFIYLATSSESQNWGIYVGSIDSADRKLLLNSESEAQYSQPGYLLFVRESTLMAQPFDARRLEVKAEPFPIAEDTGYLSNGSVSFSVSPGGVLADRAGSPGLNTRPAWFSREGKEVSAVEAPSGQYIDPELSPDGKRLAIARFDTQVRAFDVWLIDLIRNVPSRFTFDRANEFSPIWSPDGTDLAFASNRTTQLGIYKRRTSGGGSDELLTPVTGRFLSIEDWSRDGRFLLYTAGERSRDIWVLPLTGDRKPFAVTQTELFNENHAKFSPNGRWIAYDSNESGRYDIYVQPFPKGDGKWQISNNGGVEPRWRADGKELFFLALDGKMISVGVTTDAATFQADRAKFLFQPSVPLVAPNSGRMRFSVSADGQRFLLNLTPGQVIGTPITVTLDWTAALRK